MASWTEPPNTPECRSLQPHSTFEFTDYLEKVVSLITDLLNVLNSAAIRLHLNVEVADSPQTIGDAGFGLAQPIVVGDADIVHVFKEGVFSGKDYFIQALRCRFLHALEAEFDIDGKLLRHKYKEGEKSKCS